jgi:FO synthase
MTQDDSLPTPAVPARTEPRDRRAVAPAAMRRVLRRARDGVALNVDEAAIAMTARGEDLADLCASAARVRDAGLASAGRRGPLGGLPVTYSRKVFIPVTHLCRDTCHYCTFVTVPGKLAASGRGMYLEPDEIVAIAGRGAELGCKEALFTLGDRPEARWPQARQWLDERGYDSTLAYLRAMAIRVLEETGLLPHLNPGVMSWAELSRLKPVAPSMGMMLETTSRRLFEVRGQAHYGSPDKDPAVRMRTLTDAGRLSIPFTTGLLVGIGETLAERADTVHAIRRVHKEFGHIQEVIVQNFRAKDATAMATTPDAGFDDFVASVAVARLVLGPDMRIQAPPNLVSRRECLTLLGAGVDDWGGVSPLTPDHVNPERPWPATRWPGRRGSIHEWPPTSLRWPTPRPVSPATSIRWAGRGRNLMRSPNRWVGPICTVPSTPRVGEVRPEVTSITPSATGNPSGIGWGSLRPGFPNASTPTLPPRCARPNATRPDVVTLSTWL